MKSWVNCKLILKNILHKQAWIFQFPFNNFYNCRNSRYAEAEVTVKGIRIPAGVHVDVPVYGLHHDEDYWEDPWKFIPER